MKLLLKILFFILAIFQTNICESKVFLFGEVVIQIRFIENAIVNKNEATINSENDIAITCKSVSDLVAYRNWAKCCEATAAKGGGSWLQGGKTFAQYKAARGGTETLAKISTSTGTQRISTWFDPLLFGQFRGLLI